MKGINKIIETELRIDSSRSNGVIAGEILTKYYVNYTEGTLKNYIGKAKKNFIGKVDTEVKLDKDVNEVQPDDNEVLNEVLAKNILLISKKEDISQADFFDGLPLDEVYLYGSSLSRAFINQTGGLTYNDGTPELNEYAFKDAINEIFNNAVMAEKICRVNLIVVTERGIDYGSSISPTEFLTWIDRLESLDWTLTFLIKEPTIEMFKKDFSLSGQGNVFFEKFNFTNELENKIYCAFDYLNEEDYNE